MDERFAMCLYLYAAGGGEPQVFELATKADVGEIERALDACVPGGFVTIPMVFQDGLEDLQARVQPHSWGAWVIADSLLKSGTPR